jgi:hypothetical protein
MNENLGETFRINISESKKKRIRKSKALRKEFLLMAEIGESF